jgi:UDP:flavonoid glycosyltransferase YjiC (YdhE family)
MIFLSHLSNIGICGFLELEQTKHQEYKPNESLSSFLSSHPNPIYIGFGSIVIDNPIKLTQMIIDTINYLGYFHFYLSIYIYISIYRM